MNIRDLSRHIQQEPGSRKIERDIGIGLRTVQRYWEWAKAHNLLTGFLTPTEELKRLFDKTLPEKQSPLWSCSAYVEFVFDQMVASWLHGFHNTFEYFQGMPRRLVSDNLKVDITQAVWDGPHVQLAYRNALSSTDLSSCHCPATREHRARGVAYRQGDFMRA